MQSPAIRQLAVTPQQAWSALNDPEVVKTCLPGAANIAALVGDAVPLHSGSIAFEVLGGHGAVQGTLQVQLTPTADNAACSIHCNATIQADGATDQEAAARATAEDFLTRFGKEAQRRYPAFTPGHHTLEPAEVDDGFESTLMTYDTPTSRAGSTLYKDDKKFPAWVWPVGILVLVVLWWLSR